MTEQNKLKVMLIDDEASIRGAIECILREKYDIHAYACFTEAKEAIPTVKPHILFMDIKNKGYNGDKFLEELVGEDIQIPTIVMTGTPDRIAAKTIYYAQRMYTEEQRETLGIKLDDNIEAANRRLEPGRNAEGIDNSNKNISPYFMSKPLSSDTLLEYMKKVARVIPR